MLWTVALNCLVPYPQHFLFRLLKYIKVRFRTPPEPQLALCRTELRTCGTAPSHSLLYIDCFMICLPLLCMKTILSRYIVLLDPNIKRPKNPAYLRKYVYRSTPLGIITHKVFHISAICQNIRRVPVATWYLFISLPEMIVSLSSAPSRQLPSLARDQTCRFEACGLEVKCSVRAAWAAVPCPLCSPGNWRSSLPYMQILTSL